MSKSVRECMSNHPKSVGASDSVVSAARVMRDHHIGSLPVTENHQLLGMLTDRDITTRVVADGKAPEAMPVADVYSRDIVCIDASSDLDQALQLMARHQIRRLPVVENGRLVGMVAQADIALTQHEKRTGHLVGAISQRSDAERM